MYRCLLLLLACLVRIDSSREPAAEQLWKYFENESKESTLTSSGGNPVADKTNLLTVGERGPLLVQDLIFFDEVQHFDRERIPERIVHAKGAGAFGYFVVTQDIRPYTKATMFHPIGKKTPMVARFSTVIGERGSADTARDPRGFALRFYTDDGIWDLVGNNTPIFFVRDPLMFISFIHSQRKNPVTNLRDFDTFWDFITLRPETTFQTMRHFSDLGTPDGYRHMNGYGSHTYKLVNDEGTPVYCKFHFLTDQGIRNLTADVAKRLEGEDPDYATRDLYNHIASNKHPSWTMYIQVMTFDEAEVFRWNPFDVTKIWPETEFPLIEVGKMVLDRNPKNYFADIEQAGFTPSNIIPGIEPSPDKMLQGRLFAYTDTHYHRIGVNHKQLPVNNPFRSQVVNTMRDGQMTYTDNQGGAPNYFPSSFGKRSGCANAEWSRFSTVGDVARYNTSDEDHFSQPAIFWRDELTEYDRKALVKNMADHLSNAASIFQASPALVSRCGLVNFDLAKNGWKLWLDNWIANLPVEWKDKGIGEKLELLLGRLFPACLRFINTSCRKVVDDGPYHNVTTALKIVDFHLTTAYSPSSDSIPNGTWTIAALIMGILWGLGGALDCPSKLKFDAFFKNLYAGDDDVDDDAFSIDENSCDV